MMILMKRRNRNEDHSNFIYSNVCITYRAFYPGRGNQTGHSAVNFTDIRNNLGGDFRMKIPKAKDAIKGLGDPCDTDIYV